MKIFRQRIDFETKTQIEFVNITDQVAEVEETKEPEGEKTGEQTGE